MNHVWTLTLNDYIEIMEEAIVLAKERGKQVGENIEQEFFEIAKKKNKEIKHLGITDQDIDMLTGNLRERGFKIKNLKEEQRRQDGLSSY
jgi:uncharacterized protein (DUF1015 family)